MTSWCIRVPCFVYGVLGSILGFYWVVWDDTLRKDIAHAKTPTSVLGLHFLVGFFIFDVTYNIFFNASRSIDRQLWVHHFVSIIVSVLTEYYETGTMLWLQAYWQK